MQIRNSINLIGHLGAKPEMLNTKTGQTFAKFRLATNDYYKDQEGQRIERTEWHTIMAFGKQAEYIKDSLDKGNQVALNGTLRYRQWTDKNEQKRTDAVIHLNHYSKLTSAKNSASNE